MPGTRPILSRRRFFLAGAAAFLPAGLRSAPRAVLDVLGLERNLSFFHTHTRERLSACYWKAGYHCPEALAEINHVLRDHVSGAVREIDVRLLDLLHRLAVRIGNGQPLHVISGYRSPETNAWLRSRSGGVAANSLHLVGQAVDIRLPGCRLADLRQAALGFNAGGVGYYPKSDFVHVDVGRVRSW